MEPYFDIVKGCALFSNMDEAQLSSLLACLGARRETCRRGEYLLRAGDAPQAVGLLLTGSLLVFQEDFWGNRNIMAHIGPGQVFAEAFACAPGEALNASVAAESESQVLWLNARKILTTCPAACAHHSRLVRNFAAQLAAQCLRVHEKLTHMGQRTTRAKLLSYLSAQARRQGGPSFSIPFDRQQLADYLCVERSAMSAELGKMRRDGLIAYRKNAFTLLERPM